MSIATSDDKAERHLERVPSPARPPKVLLVIDQFWGPHGGTEQNVLFLCRNLPGVGITTQFAALSHCKATHRELFDVPTRLLSAAKSRLGIGFAKKVFRLSRLIRDEEFDLIHALCPLSEIAAVLATSLARRGIVIGSRRNIGYWHTTMTLFRSRLVTRFVRHFVANSQAAKEAAARLERIPMDRISVIHNAVDWQRCEDGLNAPYSRDSLGIAPHERVVVLVANIRPVKDHETFLRAAQLVLASYPDTRFCLVGEGRPDYCQQIRTLARALGIHDHLLWLGTVDNPYSVLAIADVGVLSSESEGFPNALLEYFAAELACVATAVGGVTELIQDGENGYLVPPHRPDVMADRIMRLLSDQNARVELAASARARVAHRHAPQTIARQYFDTYLRVMT